MTRTTITQLRAGDPDPEGEPRRYENANGYVRLRWKVGRGQYMERYERNGDGSLVRSRPSDARRIDIDTAVEMYSAGSSTTAIGRRLGFHPSVVSRALAKRSVVTRGRVDYLPPIDVDKLVSLYKGGAGQQALADEFGISAARVRALLRSNGVRVRPRGERDPRVPLTYEGEFQRQRLLVLERCDGRCEVGVIGFCRGAATEVHHRQTRAQGGSNALTNLLAVCGRCHRYIHANPAAAYEHGWLIRRGAA
jgi:hypothetical protein